MAALAQKAPRMNEVMSLDAWNNVYTDDYNARLMPRPLNGTVLVKLYKPDVDPYTDLLSPADEIMVVEMKPEDRGPFGGEVSVVSLMQYALEAHKRSELIKRLGT